MMAPPPPPPGYGEMNQLPGMGGGFILSSGPQNGAAVETRVI